MQKGTTSTSPKTLKRRDFPSITGRPATGPIFPSPSIAVPSVTIAETFLDLEYGSCYLTIFLKVFSEKYGFNLYRSLKLSSIMTLPKEYRNQHTLIKFVELDCMFFQASLVMIRQFIRLDFHKIPCQEIFTCFVMGFCCYSLDVILDTVSDDWRCFGSVC